MATRRMPPNPEEVEHYNTMLAMGHTRADIARKYGRSRQYISRIVGGVEEGKKKRGERTIYVEGRAWRRAQNIALRHGFRIRTGENAGQGSVAMLVENIGNGHLKVVPVKKKESNASSGNTPA